MKKLLFFVLTAALMFGCKKDDNAPTLPATDTTLPKKIVKVISTFEEPDHEAETITKEFSYDESGRLIRIDETDSDDFKYESTIEYAENQVKLTETGGGSTETYTFRLNNGRAESYVYSGDDYEEAEFSYGESGYLKEFVSKWTDDFSNETTTSTIPVTIDETGFLKKISLREGEEEEEEEILTLDFVPNTAVRNNLNLDLMYIGEVLEETDELSAIYGYLLGVCGKRTTCLPQQYTLTEAGESYTYKYDYVFDGEYISKIVIDYGDGEKSTLELFYEE